MHTLILTLALHVSFFSNILNNVETAFRHYGYLIIFLPILGESAGIPLPGETVLLAGGLAASKGILSLPGRHSGRRLGGHSRRQHRLPRGASRRPAAALALRRRPARQGSPDRHSRQLLRKARAQDGVLWPLGDLPARLGGAVRRRLTHALARSSSSGTPSAAWPGRPPWARWPTSSPPASCASAGSSAWSPGCWPSPSASPWRSSSTACRSGPRTAPQVEAAEERIRRERAEYEERRAARKAQQQS